MNSQHFRQLGESRLALMQAFDIARELDHDEVGPEHVLLALLANVRGSAYGAFAAHGVTYDLALDAVRRAHEERTASAAPSETAPGDEGDPDGVSPPQDSFDEDRAALRALGIDLDRVREAVRANFGDDITDGWGERAERSGGRGPGGRGRSGRRGGPGGPGGRGRRGPRGMRDRLSPSLQRVFAQMRDETMADWSDDFGFAGRRGGRGPWPGPAGGPWSGPWSGPQSRESRGDAGERRGRHGCDPRGRFAAFGTDRLLVALIDSDDPMVDVVVDLADDPAAVRSELGSAQAPA